MKKNRRSIIFIFVIFIAQLIVLKVEAQELSRISFNEKLTVQEINILLKQNNYPFFIVVDSISSNRISNIDNIVFSKIGDVSKQILRFDSSAEGIEWISQISNQKNLIYRISLGEYLVGYDRFLVYDPITLDSFLSEKYNYEQSSYSFVDKFINLKSGRLRIKFKNGEYKIIRFYKII